MIELKLFVVRKVFSTYRSTTVEFTKYFVANSIETVKAVLVARYGKLKSFHYDDEETEYTVEEVEVECL